MSQILRLKMDEYHACDERITDENDMEIYLCPYNDFLGGKVRKKKKIY